jgi:hypothetical protein
VAIGTKFVKHKKKILKQYKLHSKLYKLNLEDTMAGCKKTQKEFE